MAYTYLTSSITEEAFAKLNLNRAQFVIDDIGSYMAYTCLTSSITEEAFAKLNLNRAQFVIDDIGCGALLLKMIIQASHEDT